MTQDRKAKKAARDLSQKNDISYSAARKLLSAPDRLTTETGRAADDAIQKRLAGYGDMSDEKYAALSHIIDNEVIEILRGFWSDLDQDEAQTLVDRYVSAERVSRNVMSGIQRLVDGKIYSVTLNPVPGGPPRVKTQMSMDQFTIDDFSLGDIVMGQDTIVLDSPDNGVRVNIPWNGQSGKWSVTSDVELINGHRLGLVEVIISPFEGGVNLALSGTTLPTRDMDVDLSTGEVLRSGTWVGPPLDSEDKLPETRDDRTTDLAARSVEGQTLKFEVPSLIDPECTEIYTTNVDGGVGGIFNGADSGILAAIRTGSGMMVYAHDEGGKGVFTLSDGSTYSSWVHPCDADGEDVSEHISLSEMKALEEADRISTELGFIDNVDPNLELTDIERDTVVISRLEGLRAKRPAR